MTVELTDAERLKFVLLAEGLTITAGARAYIELANGDRPMTPADYASTSGIILELEDDVWVNAPLAEYNPNFVAEGGVVLDRDSSGLCVVGHGVSSAARFWLPPAFHGTCNDAGELYNSYAFTHADRVRIAPIEGCAMTCKFCDLPYEFRYRKKRVDGLVESVEVAASDEIQPAHHVLISGGTPRDADVGYVREVYEAIINGFPGLPVDIMMVPLDELIDVSRLDSLGLNELSINLELFNRDIARTLMRRKHDQGRDHYLGFIERAASILGRHRVRSMLMVGLEPVEDTLKGVQAIAQRGAVPVLSPFRPDPSTPLRDHPPPDADMMIRVYLEAREICDRLDVPLGPSCIPCSHNTMTLAAGGSGDAFRSYGDVNLI